MLLLSCRKLKKSFGHMDVLKSVDFDIYEGSRIGLVGRNGAGKTTLVNIISGNLKQDGGSITWSNPEVKLSYLWQSTSYTENEFHNMVSDKKDINENLLEVASHLGLKKLKDWDNDRFSGLSGGEKTKLALSDLWVNRGSFLILDEPTNHMDFEGIAWLVAELKKFKGTVLIISHDRFFLDETVDCILDLDEGIVTQYSGNYTYYVEEKKQRYKSQLHKYETKKKHQEKIEVEIEQVKRWSAKAHTEAGKKGVALEIKKGGKEFNRAKAKRMDKQVKSRIKHLERMLTDGIEKPKEEYKVNFDLYDAPRHSKYILEAKDIKKRFGEKALFEDSSFYIQRGNKVGLIGANGCGKTTLLKAILGLERLDSGRITVSNSLRIAYLSQDIKDIDKDQTPMEMLDLYNKSNESGFRTQLANMGFNESMLKKKIKELSLGEAVRLKIAKLLIDENDLLILDEPMNHLDLASREQLENVLEEYNGTLLIASHDKYMINKICSHLLIFEGGKIIKIEGNVEHYENSFGAKNDAREIAERSILIENRMALLIGELNSLDRNDPHYEILQLEFLNLSKEKINLREGKKI